MSTAKDIWQPEDFKFELINTTPRSKVYRYKNFELRRMNIKKPGTYWLLRKFVKVVEKTSDFTEKGFEVSEKEVIEKRVTFFLRIEQTDVNFAKMLFTKHI